MEIHQGRYFLTVCETLNFTRAAEHCNVSQPSLTAAIKKLEEELGGPLFRRERHRSHLTDLGRLMKPHFERILAARDAAEAEADDFFQLSKAPLRLGVMSTIAPDTLVKLFGRMKEDIPGVELEIVEASGPVLVQRLLAGDIDIGLLGLPKYPDRFDIRELYTERYVIAFPYGHIFEHFDAVPLVELEKQDYLLRTNCECHLFLDELGIVHSYEKDAKFKSEREECVPAMIAAGLGVSIMPEFMTNMTNIETRPIAEPKIQRTVSLITVAGRRFSPAVEVFVGLASTLHPSIDHQPV